MLVIALVVGAMISFDARYLLGLSVLLHKGKGGGLSSLFGGGMQTNLSGSTVAEKNLDRLTVGTGVVWLLCIIALNLALHYG